VSETTGVGTVESVYDSANQLTSVGATGYTWDANGNLTNDGGRTYVYNAANRLTGVTQNGQTVNYRYRCNGLSIGYGSGCESDRVSQTVNGVSTTYVLDQAAGLTQALSDGTNTYLYGNGRIGQVTGMDSAYFLGDALGSVRQLVVQDGAIALVQNYTPYGEVMDSTGKGETAYSFTGEWNTGRLLYLRTRFYSFDGRFLTRDTWKGDHYSPKSNNAWLYGYANPVGFTDPSGKCPAGTVDYGNGICEPINFPVPIGKNEKIKPSGIDFYPDADPLYLGARGIPHGVNEAQHLNEAGKEEWGSRYGFSDGVTKVLSKRPIHRDNPNLCGLVSIAAILRSVDPTFHLFDVLNKFEESYSVLN